MKRTGPGKIFAFPTNWRCDGDVLWADATVLLYNFDVDGSDLKEQHKDFLNKQLVLDFALNTEARITMVGQASLSGEKQPQRSAFREQGQGGQRLLRLKRRALRNNSCPNRAR